MTPTGHDEGHSEGEPLTTEQHPDGESNITFVDGQLFTLTLVAQGGKLHFKANWKQTFTEEQQYDLAVAVDKIMRSLAPAYARRIDAVETAASLGFKIEDAPKPVRTMLERWFK